MFKLYFDRFRQNKLALIGLGIILLLVVLAFFAVKIAKYDPTELHLLQRLHGPSSQFLLGTDDLGRDVYSRMIHGIRISLTVGFVAVSIAVVIGTLLGVDQALAVADSSADFVVEPNFGLLNQRFIIRKKHRVAPFLH